MKISFYMVLLVLSILSACNEVKVGFLNTTYAAYKPDSLVVKKTIDPDVDWTQAEYGADWVSAPLQGIDGTAPIFITIHEVVAEAGGDAEKFLKEAVLRGDGTFAIPLKNNIPLGRYRVSLNVSNEDHVRVLDSVFTVCVVDK